MPSSLQNLDTSFPKIDGHQTTEENFNQVTNYLYMLLENLRYTLGNLGEGNFNDTELASIATMIREPIWARIEDAEGNLNTLNVTAKNLLSQISDLDGNVSTLTQTAHSLSTKIQSVQGDVSTLTQTAASLSTRIQSAEGSLSTLSQTASSLSSRVQSAEGSISSLTQTATGLSSRVQSVEGGLSSLTQTVEGMELSVSNGSTSSTIRLRQDGVTISSVSVSFSGMVTFSDLSSSGSTTINGNNITTGTISADYIRLYSSMAVYTGYSGSTVGGYIGYTSSANDGSAGIHLSKGNGEVVATSNGAKLLYRDTDNQIYIANGTAGVAANGGYFYFAYNNFRADGQQLLGTASALWGQIYSTNATVSVSDRNKKHAIEALPDQYLALFDGLVPRRFKLNDGTSDRYHVGFVSQEVEQAMTAAGLTSLAFGGFVKDTDEETGEALYFLRYEEFIAILAAKIKQLEERLT